MTVPRSLPALIFTIMDNRREEVQDLASFFRKRIGLGKFVVVLVFGYLSFVKTEALLKDVAANLPDALLTVKAQILDQLSLILYSSSWAAGMLFDVGFQEATYAEIVTGQKVRKTANRLTVLVLVGFVCVCFAMTLPKLYFWMAILIFCVVDVLSWKVLMKKSLRPTYDASKNHYAVERPPGYVKNLVKLELTWIYVADNWKIRRYLAMGIVVLTGMIFSIKPGLYPFVARKLHCPAQILPSLLLLLYVLVAEGWMWVRRIECHALHERIDELFGGRKISRNYVMELELPGNSVENN